MATAFNKLDDIQKKHYLAALYHELADSEIVQKGKGTAKEEALSKYHQRMAHLHANHGGLDYQQIWNARISPSQSEDSEHYSPGLPLPQDLESKSHEHDSLLPADADKMMQGLKHHILQRAEASDRSDSYAKDYHDKMAKWHSAMLGNEDPEWTPEEIASYRAKQNADETAEDPEFGKTRHSKDPIDFGTEVFPKYQHGSVKHFLDNVNEDHWDAEGQLKKQPLLRPEDVAQIYKEKGSRLKTAAAEHPFLPEEHKIAHVLSGSKGDSYPYKDALSQHPYPSLTRKLLPKIEEMDREEPGKMAEFMSARPFDREMHQAALESRDPELRGLGLIRLEEGSPRLKAEIEKEKQKLFDADGDPHSLDRVIQHIPSKDVPQILESHQNQFGKDDQYEKMVDEVTQRWGRDYHHKDAADLVNYIAKNHPEKLENMRGGHKHILPGNLNLSQLPYKTLKALVEDPNTSSGAIGDMIKKQGPLSQFVRHPNAPRDVLDQIRDSRKGGLRFARNLLKRPGHSREDLLHAKKLLLDKEGNGDSSDEQLIQNSPHWTNDELADHADKHQRRADLSWVAAHPNASPQLLQSLALDHPDLHDDIKANPNASPGTIRHIASVEDKHRQNLSDPRLPIEEAIKHYESLNDRYKQSSARNLLAHPMLPEEKAKELIAQHGLGGRKPKELSPAELQFAQIAPPASVPNVRKDKLLYEAKHKPSSLAIEALAKEFESQPSLTWAKVKKNHPHLEFNPEVRKIFEDKPELAQEDFMKRVGSLEDKSFPVSYRKWTGMQRHNSAPQLVVQLNAGMGFRKQLAKKQGLLQSFDDLKDRLFTRHHPVLPHSIGWARVDTSHPEHWFVDEIQSDLDGDLRSHWDENLQKLGQKAEQVKSHLKGWNESLLQHVINIARSHGVKRLSIHSKKSKMKINHGDEDKPSSKYKEIYDDAPRKAGFEKARAGDVGLHHRSNTIHPDMEIRTLDLTNHKPVASNGPKEMGSIKRKRKADAPSLGLEPAAWRETSGAGKIAVPAELKLKRDDRF